MTGDAFTRALAKTVVAQIFDGVGVHSTQVSVLDTLSDVLLRYISTIGERAHGYAEHAGRTECNLNDVLAAFSDLGTSITDLVKYVEFSEEIPFVRSTPRFPVKKKPRLNVPSFDQMEEEPPSSHIPSWLPAFPDKHTYVSTPSWIERKNDARADRIQQGNERRQAENALISLHKRVNSLTAGNRKELWGAGIVESINVESKQDFDRNRIINMGEIFIQEDKYPVTVAKESMNPFSSPTLSSNPIIPAVMSSLNELSLPSTFEPDPLVMDIRPPDQESSKPSMLESFPETADTKRSKREDVDEIELWEDETTKKDKMGTENSGWGGWKLPEKKASLFEFSPLTFHNKFQRKAIATRALLSTSEGMAEAEEDKKAYDSDREGGADEKEMVHSKV